MNIDKVFNFIKEKRGYDYPFIYKLIKGIPLTEDELNIEGILDLGYTNITSLPDNLKVEGSINLSYTDLRTLPENFKVNGYLNLRVTPISNLPDNLHVGGWFGIESTNIDSIPNKLFVKTDLYVKDTPLSEKYSIYEIRKMIEDKGGFIGGFIFI
jgi:hypothetical protein